MKWCWMNYFAYASRLLSLSLSLILSFPSPSILSIALCLSLPTKQKNKISATLHNFLNHTNLNYTYYFSSFSLKRFCDYFLCHQNYLKSSGFNAYVCVCNTNDHVCFPSVLPLPFQTPSSTKIFWITVVLKLVGDILRNGIFKLKTGGFTMTTCVQEGAL